MADHVQCEKSTAAPGNARTFVAKVLEGHQYLDAHGTAELIRGAGAYALVVVHRCVDEADEGCYFVLTERREKSASKHATSFMRALRESAGNPRADWIGPLSRRLQRLFGWGDVFAGAADVHEAVSAGNEEELVAIMPGSAVLIDRGELALIPRAEEAIRCGLPALPDCQHTFFTEETPLQDECGGAFQNRRENGEIETRPCPRGPNSRCTGCGAVRCKLCATALVRDAAGQLSGHRELLKACHDCSDAHSWKPMAGPVACRGCASVVAEPDGGCTECGAHPECDMCGARRSQTCACGTQRCWECVHEVERRHQWGPVVDGGEKACSKCGASGAQELKACSCGAFRCHSCIELTRPAVETIKLKRNPLQPQPFYVQVTHPGSNEQIALLRQELGRDSSLGAFARRFKRTFPRVGINAQSSQKAASLKLYRAYAAVDRDDLDKGAYATVDEARKKLYSMECQIPPGELEEFQKVWDKDAPRRCRECNRPLPAGAPSDQLFCCDAHAAAGKSLFCSRRAGPPDEEGFPARCTGKVVLRNGWHVCTVCEHGKKEATRWPRPEGGAACEMGREQPSSTESLRLASNIWFSGVRKDPGYIPSWTKRRRL